MKTHDSIVRQKNLTLLELLDRLLDKGVMVKGEIVLSVADIDLVYLNLGLLLSSLKTIEQARRDRSGSQYGSSLGNGKPDGDFFMEKNPNIKWVNNRHTLPQTNGESTNLGPRVNIDPNKVEQGLANLVLTVVELLRRLMEKQAIRRMEAGFLTETEAEKVGFAFKKLDERMDELKDYFGLKDEDLNLDLGPIGHLM